MSIIDLIPIFQVILFRFGGCFGRDGRKKTTREKARLFVCRVVTYSNSFFFFENTRPKRYMMGHDEC